MSVIWSGVTEEGAVVPVQVTAEGKVVAVGDGPEGEYLKLAGGNLTGDLTVNEQITLATDGSATFAGEARATDGSSYAFLAASGWVSTYRDKPAGNSEADLLFAGQNETDTVFRVYTDGSASFAERINALRIDCISEVGSSTYKDKYNSITKLGGSTSNVDYGIVIRSASGATAFWGVSPRGVTTAVAGATYGGNVETPNIILNLDLDNDANYTVTTSADEEGNEVETRVYNGPTLDVKELLLTLQTAAARIATLEAKVQILETGRSHYG